MIKPIKSKTMKNMTSEHIPYKNNWGNWVWRAKDVPENKSWPGLKAPEWTKTVTFFNGQWCWSDEISKHK